MALTSTGISTLIILLFCYLLPCYFVTLLPYWIIGLLHYYIILFSNSRLTKPGTQTSPERRINLDLRPGQTLCMATIAFSGWGLWTWLMEMMPWLHLLFYFILFYTFSCIIIFSFPFLISEWSSRISLVYHYFPYMGLSWLLYIHHSNSLWHFSLTFNKTSLCPFLLDCIPTGQQPHHFAPF